MARLADKLPDFHVQSLEVDPKEVRLGKRRLVRKKHHTSSFLKPSSSLDSVPLPKIQPPAAGVLEAASREILQTLGRYEVGDHTNKYRPAYELKDTYLQANSACFLAWTVFTTV